MLRLLNRHLVVAAAVAIMCALVWRAHVAARPAALERALMAAIRDNDDAAAAKLLARGANPDARTADGVTPLMLMALHGRSGMVRSLVGRRAQVNARDNFGQTALMYCGDVAIALVLIDHGALVNARDRDGSSALLAAGKRGNDRLMKLLIDRGANPSVMDEGRTTPLHWAALNGFTNVVKLMMEKGAGVNAADRMGYTPLMNAASRGRQETVRALLERGAAVNSQTREGETALMDAIGSGCDGCVRALLAGGADPNVDGRTFYRPLRGALFLVKLHPSPSARSIVALLRQAGANE